MGDFFVDKILENARVEQEWIELTKELFKINDFNYMLNLFLSTCEDINELNYRSNSLKKYKNKYLGSKKITDIADEFNLEPLGRKLRICPFHKDTNPSLSLSNERGCFNCFGCGLKGNIITFYAMLKKVKNNGSK